MQFTESQKLFAQRKDVEASYGQRSVLWAKRSQWEADLLKLEFSPRQSRWWSDMASRYALSFVYQHLGTGESQLQTQNKGIFDKIKVILKRFSLPFENAILEYFE